MGRRNVTVRFDNLNPTGSRSRTINPHESQVIYILDYSTANPSWNTNGYGLIISISIEVSHVTVLSFFADGRFGHQW